MNNYEIFFIGLFCGAYGMFTLLGMVILAKREPKHGADGL